MNSTFKERGREKVGVEINSTLKEGGRKIEGGRRDKFNSQGGRTEGRWEEG